MPNTQRRKRPLPDITPRVPLKTVRDRLDRGESLTPDEQELERKYRLLTDTVDSVIHEGRFSTALKTGDIVGNLRDAAVAGSVSHLSASDADLVTYATSVTRHLIYEAKRKISHPRKMRDQYGALQGWTAPTDAIPTGVSGQRLCGSQGRNLSEDAMVEELETAWRWLGIAETLGQDDYRRLRLLLEQGSASNAERQWLCRVKKRLKKFFAPVTNRLPDYLRSDGDAQV